MTNEQAERLSELFAIVLEVDPSAREPFLRQNCPNDAERDAVRCLLAADKQLDGYWLDPLLDDIALGRSQSDLSRKTDRDYIGLVLKDRYTIVDQLDSGGTSLVYLATDATLGDKWVVKVLRESTVDGEWFRERFQQEIKTLVLLKGHEGIVPVSDAGLTPDGQPYYVMPYVEGTTLKSEICRGPIAFARVAGILRQIGAALTYAHGKDVCHLDLKPGNVFLREIGDGGLHVSLIDFGTARMVPRGPGAAAEVSRLVGTPTYMAPEQFVGRPSGISDQYALGLIALEMLTGQLPSEVDFQQLEAIKAGRPGQLSYALPMSTQRALARALALDPRSRYDSAAACGEEIARSLFNDAPWRLWDTIRAFLGGIWSRRALRAVGILSLVGLFVYLMIALFGPPGRVPPPPPVATAGGDRVDELRDAYTVRRREFSTNLYWQCGTALLGLLLAMRAGTPLKVRSMGLTIPVTWLYFALPAVLIYLWLEFGFLLDDLIKWRAEAWAELAKSGAISRASGFNDGGYLDGWFMAFRPTEHSIDSAFRAGAVFFFFLVYCPLFAIGHACAVVLPYFGAGKWLDSSKGQARALKALLCFGLPSAVLIASHLQFLLGGKNPNCMQPVVGVIVVVLCVFLVLHARHGRA